MRSCIPFQLICFQTSTLKCGTGVFYFILFYKFIGMANFVKHQSPILGYIEEVDGPIESIERLQAMFQEILEMKVSVRGFNPLTCAQGGTKSLLWWPCSVSTGVKTWSIFSD